MANFIPQKIRVDFITDSPFALLENEKAIEITKDLDEEPNTAEISAWALTPDQRDAISAAAREYTPVEIWYTAIGSEEFVCAYRGEVETVQHYPPTSGRPEFETRVTCASQKRAHIAAYLEHQTYAKGTSRRQIVSDILTAIGLPTEYEETIIPDTGILLGVVLSGPAFPVLQGLVKDFGCTAYILDGVIHISRLLWGDDDTQVSPARVIKITDDMLLQVPQDTTRTAPGDVAIQVVAESFDGSRRAYRKARQKRELGKNDYTLVQAIDTMIPGKTFDLFGIPNIDPDMVLEYQDGRYRAHTVNHFGDDFGSPVTTRVYADNIEGEGV